MKFNFIEKSCNNIQVNRWRRRRKKNGLAHILTVLSSCFCFIILFFYDDHFSKTYAAFCAARSSLVKIQCDAIGGRLYNSFTLWIPALWYFIKCVLILKLDVGDVCRSHRIMNIIGEWSVKRYLILWSKWRFWWCHCLTHAHTFIQEGFTIHIRRFGRRHRCHRPMYSNSMIFVSLTIRDVELSFCLRFHRFYRVYLLLTSRWLLLLFFFFLLSFTFDPFIVIESFWFSYYNWQRHRK